MQCSVPSRQRCSDAHSLLKLLGKAGERQLALARRLQRLEGAADIWLGSRHPVERRCFGPSSASAAAEREKAVVRV